MLDKRLLTTGVSLLLVCTVAAASALFPAGGAEAQPIDDEPAAEVLRPRIFEPEPPERERDYLYIIREYEGRVAVFGHDSDIPEIILETFVRHLPIYDRIQLQVGVRVYSTKELEARIEDYTS